MQLFKNGSWKRHTRRPDTVELYLKVEMWSFYWTRPGAGDGCMSVIGWQAANTCQGSGWKRFTFPSHVGHDQPWYLTLAAVIVFTYIQKYIQTCCIMLSVPFKDATIHPYAWICTSFVFTRCLVQRRATEWGLSSQSWSQFTEHSARKCFASPG